MNSLLLQFLDLQIDWAHPGQGRKHH